MKPKVEVRLCVERYGGGVNRYKKKDLAAAEKDAEWYRVTSTGKRYYAAVWLEEREVAPWVKVEGTETRR